MLQTKVVIDCATGSIRKYNHSSARLANRCTRLHAYTRPRRRTGYCCAGRSWLHAESRHSLKYRGSPNPDWS
jgi:hypothetical protein